jgi:hypothetical protein
MKWHYDVTGAEPIIRDIPVYNSGAITRGTAMCSGPVATEVNNGRSIIASPAVLSNIIGVIQEDVTAANALAVLATGFETYAKHIINPFAVWLAEYATGASDDIAITTASATGKSVTAPDTGDANQTGSWVYITGVGSSIGGKGNLFCVGGATGTTVLTAVTDYDDYLKANIVSDTFITLHPRYGATVVGGSVSLDSTSIKVQGLLASGNTGAALILENYIESAVRSLQPLVISTHSGINFASENPRFYGDLMFSEHLLAAGGTVCNRVIN